MYVGPTFSRCMSFGDHGNRFNKGIQWNLSVTEIYVGSDILATFYCNLEVYLFQRNVLGKSKFWSL